MNHVRALGGMSPDRDTLLKSVSILLPKNDGSSIRIAVYAGGQLDGGPHSDPPAKLLFDFGQTPKGETGWNTLKHPKGIRIPAKHQSGSCGKAPAERWKFLTSKNGQGRVNSNQIAGDGTAKPSNSFPRYHGHASGQRMTAANSITFEYSCFLTFASMDRSSK